MSGSNGAIIGAPNLALIDSITQFNNGSQATWNTITIPIPQGLVVYAIDTTAVKIGDGVTLYADLPVVFYLNSIATLGQQMMALYGDLATMPTIAAMNAAIAAALTAALSGYVTLAGLAVDLGAYAPKVSPTFTGVPVAPTPAANDGSQTLATTAYVDRADAALALAASAGITPDQLQTYIGGALSNYVTTIQLGTALSAYTTTVTLEANYAPKASPTFTGIPAAPTPALGDNSPAVATTAFVVNAGGNFANAISLTASTVLTADNVGCLFVDNSSGSAPTFTLPALSAVRSGSTVSFRTVNPNGCSIVCASGTTDSIDTRSASIAANVSSISLIDGDNLMLVAGAGAWHVYSGTTQLVNTNRIRNRLRSNAAFYVNSTTGSDLTGEGTLALPWASLTYAWNYIQANYDVAGYFAQVNCTGDFTTGLSAGGPITGATGPSSVIFDGGGTATVAVTNSVCFNLAAGAQCTIQNWGVCSATGTVLHGGPIILNASGSGTNVNFKAINFGVSTNWHIVANLNSLVTAIGGFTISGGAVFSWDAQVGATLVICFQPITLSGTPNFSGAFAEAVSGGNLIAYGNTFSGGATGMRYNANTGGNIDTNNAGANYFPGTVAGSSVGGYYV